MSNNDNNNSNANVGDWVAKYLGALNIDKAFGVISIHNMPILDAFTRHGMTQFITARGEAGAANMADGAARVTGGLSVLVTSTGTGAGNAAGALLEAANAESPMLHLTGQIPSLYVDKNWGYIHEATDQPGMLKSIGKGYWRVNSGAEIAEILPKAIACALSYPQGPVHVEIPIDVQKSLCNADIVKPVEQTVATLAESDLEQVVDFLARCKRPLLWLGGGCKPSQTAVTALADMGIGVVTSTQGRGVIDENHAMSLGSYTADKTTEELYQQCDGMLIVGSKIRSNETLSYALKLPQRRFRVDLNELARNHAYSFDGFIQADAQSLLPALAKALVGRIKVDPELAVQVSATRLSAVTNCLKLGAPYSALAEHIGENYEDFIWVRDITLSNSTWGNRLLNRSLPKTAMHATGGGIGQGLPMAIGAAVAGGKRVVCLTGDGGLQLCVGELATLAETNLPVTMVLMNDYGYGVIRNIQTAHYDGRGGNTDLLTPDFSLYAKALGMRYQKIDCLSKASAALSAAEAHPGPSIVEVDMSAIGPFEHLFAGPPSRKKSS